MKVAAAIAHDLKRQRVFCDGVEAHVRALQALGISTLWVVWETLGSPS